MAAVADNTADNESELLTDDNLLYYLPPTAEKDEDSASESMNEDVGTVRSDKQHHEGGRQLCERQFSIKKKKNTSNGHLCALFASLLSCLITQTEDWKITAEITG